MADSSYNLAPDEVGGAQKMSLLVGEMGKKGMRIIAPPGRFLRRFNLSTGTCDSSIVRIPMRDASGRGAHSTRASERYALSSRGASEGVRSA